MNVGIVLNMEIKRIYRTVFGMNRMSRYIGFTLIELLVVISVIALLLAILLPSLNMAKALAKRISCSSNLKNISMAWSVYLDDYDGRFYQGIRANLDYGGWAGMQNWWPRPLNKYVGLSDPNAVTQEDAKIFCCPADTGGVPPGNFIRDKAYLVNGTSYQTNIFLVGQNHYSAFSEHTQELDQEISRRLVDNNRSLVVNPTLLLLIGDFGWINQWKPKPYPEQEWKDLAEWHGKADYHNIIT